MNPEISLVKCFSYDQDLVYQSTRQAFDLLGGIKKFILPESRVLVKPNLLLASDPSQGVTTHPEVVRAVVRILKEIGSEVFVGDSPCIWGKYIDNVDEVYQVTGIKEVCAQEAVSLVNFNKRRWHKKFPLTSWLEDCDYLINLPKFKTHNLTLLTGAIKNLFGLIPGTFKTELHKNYFEKDRFAEILVDLYQEVKPSLTIVDAITAMELDGPGTRGKLRQANLLVAGQDCVALDSVLAVIMGIKPEEVLTTKKAASRHLGVADLNLIEIKGEKLQDAVSTPFLLPTASPVRNIPQPIVKLAKHLIKYYPCVEDDRCLKCAACIKSCPNKIIKMQKNRIKFDYKKCIACFCCQEACPASAIKIKKSLLARIVGL